ncbi:hypothetical protein HPP92_028814 [Vanilla planifolia]|uniref:Uncharacterized protein n=1 Tax=Vanilla planifolia TaxID=51239 RepID=A0A835P9J2_VANPL|nr:hypothetical protein HPP92_028814 [Vanilla planifolia]KAG0446486.1 hypothetical protein HPP92_028803 [Vanilla planifolia]
MKRAEYRLKNSWRRRLRHSAAFGRRRRFRQNRLSTWETTADGGSGGHPSGKHPRTLISGRYLQRQMIIPPTRVPRHHRVTRSHLYFDASD